MFGFSSHAVIVRHWFEINLDDASMEHGARVEVRELQRHPHRGSESAAQLITADHPLWRADIFDQLSGPPGNFAAAHYHREFTDVEPEERTWDTELSADPWSWLHRQVESLGAASGDKPWPLDPADAVEVARHADQITEAARRLAPDRCTSASQCFQLTQDVQETVQMMIEFMERPDLLDRTWVAPWLGEYVA